jgi:hypothetical protein
LSNQPITNTLFRCKQQHRHMLHAFTKEHAAGLLWAGPAWFKPWVAECSGSLNSMHMSAPHTECPAVSVLYNSQTACSWLLVAVHHHCLQMVVSCNPWHTRHLHEQIVTHVHNVLFTLHLQGAQPAEDQCEVHTRVG